MDLDDSLPQAESDGEHEFDDAKDSEQADADAKEEARRRKLHQACIDDFKASADYFSEQRILESAWRKFYRAVEPEDQWDGDTLRHRRGFTTDGDTGDVKGERPSFTINETKQPIQQTVNEARQARLGLTVKPERGKASRDEAETRTGLLRGIQFHSNAVQARLWGLESSAISGRGFYRINKEYASDGDDDLDLRIGLILHQDSVHPDPAATQMDLSDASFVVIVDDFSHQEFERRFPDAQKPNPEDGQLDAFGNYKADWANAKTYRVGERYYVEQTTKTRYRDPMSGEWMDATLDSKGMPALPEGADRVRKVPVRKIKYCLFSASDILEEGDWEGKYLPIIQTVGRVHVVDGKVYFKGLVADAMHPAQLINYTVSSLAEQCGSGTKAPYLVDPKQIEQHKAWWENSSSENYPFLPYDRFPDDLGTDYGVPVRNMSEPPILATLQLFQQARDLLKAATGRFGASLGDISPDRSGKAINALKVQGEMGSSDFLDNLANIAMVQEARVLNSMLFPIYGTPGRVAKLVGDQEDDEQDVLINQPFMEGSDGRPQPVEVPGVFARVGAAVMGGVRKVTGGAPPPQGQPKIHRLTEDGEYDVRVSVGKSLTTQREENVQLLTSILETVGKIDPNIAKAATIVLAKNLDGPAAQELSDMLSPKGPDGETIPPAIQQHVAMLEAKLKEASEAAQQMQQMLKSKKLELDREERLEMMKMQATHQIEAQRIRVEMAKINASTQGKTELEEVKAEQAKLELLLSNRHEEMLQREELATKVEMQQTQIAADLTKQRIDLDAKAEQQATQLDAAAETRERTIESAAETQERGAEIAAEQAKNEPKKGD
jgi:hypothetical protein